MHQLYVHDLLRFHTVHADVRRTQSSCFAVNNVVHDNSDDDVAFNSNPGDKEDPDSTVSFIECLFCVPR